MKSLSKLPILLLFILLFSLPFQTAHASAPLNILLLGFDFWGDETIGNSWSDVNVIVSLDMEKQRVVFISLMRDSYVQMPGGNSVRLNAVVRESDFDTMLRVIQENYGVAVPYYIAIGMSGFKRLITAAGGVEVNISRSEYESLRKRGMASGIPGPGKQVLKGSAAYNYVKDRYMGGGDGVRTGKARDLLTSLLGQMRDRPVSELLEFATVALSEIETNMPLPEIMALATQLPGMNDTRVEDYGVPIPNSFQYVTVHGMSTVQLDWEVNRAAIQRYLAGE